MKIIIAEFPETANRDLSIERAVFPKDYTLEVAVYTEEREEEFIEQCKDADAILVGYVKMPARIINRLEKCKVISVQATGYNYVDEVCAREKGIAVCAIGEYCTDEVADQAILLMLSLLKGLMVYQKSVQIDKAWIYNVKKDVRRIAGLKLGIAGFGKIGRAVAKRAQSFGMEILAYDPFISEDVIREMGAEPVSFDKILTESDVISNHMNLTTENAGIFNMEAFEKTKKAPILINVARGGSIVEEDLVKALDKGLISGAGLDVLSSETPDLQNCPLLGRENVIVTPHSAFYSITTDILLFQIPAENALKCLLGDYSGANRVVNGVGLVL